MVIKVFNFNLEGIIHEEHMRVVNEVTTTSFYFNKMENKNCIL